MEENVKVLKTENIISDRSGRMNYFSVLSNSQKKLLMEMGIYCDADMPEEFFEKIKSLQQDLTEAEIYSISDYYKPYCYDGKLDMSRLVGTDHDKYANKSWIEAFSVLSRGEQIAALYLQNPDYYKNESIENIDMGLIEKDGFYYISSKNGGGNNRLITLKLLSILQNKKGMDTVSPLVRIRKVPTIETCNNIFYCEFPDGSFTESGYKVRKTNPTTSEEYYDIIYGPIFKNNVIYENVYGHEILKTVFQNEQNNDVNTKKR